MRQFAVSVALGLLLIAHARAQELKGDWGGLIHTPSGPLHVGIRIHKLNDGGYAATFDSFDQGRWGIPFTSVSEGDHKLSLIMRGPGATYDATWDAPRQRWLGTWRQGGKDMGLDLEHATLPAPQRIDLLKGDWDGLLVRNGTRLRMSLHFDGLPYGGMGAAVEGVDLVETASVTQFSQEGAAISLTASALDWNFSGTIGKDGRSIVGQWGKGVEGTPMTFVLRAPGAPAPVLNRPQTPKKPYPYREEQVSVANEKARAVLSGTLTLPKSGGPFPAVILLGGSGPTTRDEPFSGHRPFMLLADFLTRRGFAVLRYDKRGTGASTGDYANATTADFADDAEAAVRFLQGRTDIDGRQVGLLGHSEGTLVASMIAAKNKSIAFIVLLGAPGQKGGEIIPEQFGLVYTSEGYGAAEAARQVRIQKELIRLIRSEQNAKAVPAIRALLTSSGSSEITADRRAALMTSPWARFFIDYDPTVALREVTCPVLVIDGDKDVQLPAHDNLKIIRAALAGDRDAQVTELPNLNHVLQTAHTGSASEYAENQETISPALLDLVGGWLSTHAH